MADGENLPLTVDTMSRRGFTLVELTITFCLLGILTLVAFNLYTDRAATVAEASGRSRLQVAVTAQDTHHASYGAFASASDFTDLKGVVTTNSTAEPGELSISLSNDGQQAGMATVEGELCLTVGLEAGYSKPLYSSYRTDRVDCSGALGLDSLQ